jgi:hypothetical protein
LRPRTRNPRELRGPAELIFSASKPFTNKTANDSAAAMTKMVISVNQTVVNTDRSPKEPNQSKSTKKRLRMPRSTKTAMIAAARNANDFFIFSK